MFRHHLQRMSIHRVANPPQRMRAVTRPQRGVLYCKNASLCTGTTQGGVSCQPVEICTPQGSAPGAEGVVRFSSTPSSPLGLSSRRGRGPL